MKRNILLMAFVCLSLWVKGQSRTEPITIGHVDTLYSTILKEKRPLLIYCPPHDTVYFGKPAYPVLYVLDGDGNFAFLQTMVWKLSVNNGNAILPEMIIVGIPNTRGNRDRDLTPVADTTFDKRSGGGEKFTTFLEKELIPYIDKNYPTAPYRTLIGHSLGGLMTINTLIHHTGLFNAYVAIDPSMSFANHAILKQAETILQQQDFKARSLFVAIANTMPTGMDTLRVRKDTAHINLHIRAILKLTDNLKAHPSNNLKWAYKYYPGDSHFSVPPIAEYDALRFIFANNQFPNDQPVPVFFDTTHTVDSLKKLIVAHYKLLSREMGYSVRPSESMMNMLGYSFLQQKDYGRSRMFFQLNMDYYPQSFNVYDSMGDNYLARNEKGKAITYFKKALALKYRQEIKEKLDKLEQGKN
jgi:predicted alpha/beta superfamily hydrolase